MIVLIIGATRLEKRILIIKFINYIVGVKFKYPFRFLLINEEGNPLLPNIQASHSHTSKVTAYKIHQQERLNLFYRVFYRC